MSKGDDFVQAVREGKVPGMSIDKDNPAMAYTPMDIYSKPGTTKVRYTGHGGYESDKRWADTHLKVDAVYTVANIEVGGWSSDVEFIELPGKRFNTVMFAAV
jgi:hypothetical protein